MLDTTRRVNVLRKDMNVQQAKTQGPTLGEFFAQWQYLNRLRGYWPMSSITETPTVIDMSGQGRALTFNGTANISVYNDLVPYIALNGTTGFLSRPDEAGLDITGTLTLGGLVRVTSGAAIGAFMSKYGSVVANRSYYLRYTGSNTFQFGIGDGVGDTTVSSQAIALDEWHFVLGRFSPSTSVAIFVDGTWTTNTTAVPAAIVSGAANLEIGRLNVVNGQLLAGDVGACFLSADTQSDNLVNDTFARSRPIWKI